jgi:CPA1 family monovalent cation:H+ antiporter
VLALSLPDSFPQREAIVVLTTGVVMSSLVLQGLSMSTVMRWLGVKIAADQKGDAQVNAPPSP